MRAQDDAESLELALIENMAREDLNPVEEARACALLVEELGLTREDVGRRVGRSRVAVCNLLRLLDLPDEVLDLIAEPARSPRATAAPCCVAADHADRRRLARGGGATRAGRVRETEARARAANGPTRRSACAGRAVGAALHPDQAEAAGALERRARARRSGTDVQVAPARRRLSSRRSRSPRSTRRWPLADRLGAPEAA